MPQKTPQEVLRDPKFYSLGLGDQLAVMRQIDPKFAALDPRTQGEVLYQGHMKTTHPARPEETGYGKDPGFIPTLTGDIKGMASGLMPQNWERTARGIAQSHIDTAKEAYRDLSKGQYTPATAEALAALIPVLGPMASQIGNEIANRQWGAASAHLLEMFGPEVIRGGKAAAATETGTRAGAITRGSLKGGYEGLKRGRAGGAALTAGEIGYALGGPKGAAIGAATAASPEVIRGAVRGAREELGKLPPKAPPVASPGAMRQVLAESRRMNPRVVEPPPTFRPEPPQGGLPSGRRVGPAPPSPPVPAPERYQAPYSTEPSVAEPPAPLEPISGNLPSGRKVGPAPSRPVPEPPQRIPVWQRTSRSPEPPTAPLGVRLFSSPPSPPIESAPRVAPRVAAPEGVQRPPGALSHPAFARLQESIGNKASAIALYLRENGIRPETLRALPENQRNALANEAYDWAKSRGMSVPKSKYRGISDDTLQMILEKLNEAPK